MRKTDEVEYTIGPSHLSPVLILSLDTTTRAGSAALLDDELIRAVIPGDASRTHGERLPGELVRVLEQGGVPADAVDLLAVASGPGAFTGLRIGLAAMQGVAMALDRPVVGVSALDAMAVAGFESLGVARARIGAWMDAARGEVFAALYDVERVPGELPRLTPLTTPEAAPPEAIWSTWNAPDSPDILLVGDGAVRYRDAVAMGTRILAHPVLAPTVARLGRRVAAAGGSHRPHHLQPLYVRRPDVAPARGASAAPASATRVEPLGGSADLDAVIAIEEASFNNPTTRAWYEAELARPDVCAVYVIRTAETPVAGFVAFWRILDEMHINNLAVHPEFRGRGLGRALLHGTLAAAGQTGIRRATLEVRRSNAPALRLYEGAGFAVVGVRPNYYSQPVEDALVLSTTVESP